MAQLLVRNIDEVVKARLRERAARNNRSLEAEARAILTAAAFAAAPLRPGFGTAVQLLSGTGGLASEGLCFGPPPAASFD